MSVMANRCKREQAAEVRAIKTVERVLSGAVSKVLAQLNDRPLCGSSNIVLVLVVVVQVSATERESCCNQHWILIATKKRRVKRNSKRKITLL